MTAVPTPHEGPSTGEPAPKFQQHLGAFDGTMLVAGTMIGSGIFIVTAPMSRELGSPGWLMAAWILTGVMTIFGALSYAELAAMMPQAGGQYVYLREAYSPLWGFLYGWAVFLIIQTGSIAAVGVAFARFLGVLVPQLGTDNILFKKDVDWKISFPGIAEPIFQRSEFTISAGQLVAVLVVALLTWLNCRGVQSGKWVQNIFTVAKTLALILLIVVGLTIAADASTIANNMRDWWSGGYETSAVRDLHKRFGGPELLAILMVGGGAMVGSLFSADAWNNVTFTAGEMRNPKRNLPLSLLFGTGTVIALYMLANLAYLATLPIQGDAQLAEALTKELKAADTPAAREAVEEKYRASVRSLGIDHARDDRVGTAALQTASPRLGVPFMALAIMISTFGCVNGMILMGARLYYAMARDGLFFQSVGGLNRRGVPAVGLVLQGAWSIALIFSGTYNELLDYVIFAALLFYVLTVAGLFVLRRTRPAAERPYRALGYPVLPATYMLLCAVVMVDLLIVKPAYTWPGLILVLTGIPVYFIWKRLGRAAP